MRQCRFLLSSGVFILVLSNGPFVFLISATVSLKENNTGYVVSISKYAVIILFFLLLVQYLGPDKLTVPCGKMEVWQAFCLLSGSES